ncbi:hypothetical protein GQ43DRAFT_397365 [Delitschia confertaspora ATCC 74209]|uniref:Ankyrin repeat protein n=1 Tax=Delitschia confertaspora ATCC 74209 TaxID=1513339 RepID=A0A9P4JJ03_9PLEO|nr:hypothetical protein GQ43DRAFT_397365 [Delitschia confertaspora ATCC 74209]
MAASPAPTIDVLLNLIDRRPDSILTSLSQHPHLASAGDQNGYTLVHASASYNQLHVLRALVNTHGADVNMVDSDGDSALFYAETIEAAKCLIEDLGADWRRRNAEGISAEEKILGEEGPENAVYLYLKSLREQTDGPSEPQTQSTHSVQAPIPSTPSTTNAASPSVADVHPPPPLPEGVQINVGTASEDEVGVAPDPEFRRRIEELAAREDFQSEEGQRQLRELVMEAVSGLTTEEAGRSARRRVE